MTVLKAILLCGGHGSRLAPFTRYCNKHLLPIYHKSKGKPIVDFGIEALREAGITDIAIVLGDAHCEDIFGYLKDGSQHGVNYSYFWQGEPLGIAHAVTCAKRFISHDEGFFVYLGDNFFANGIKNFVNFCSEKPFVKAGILFAQAKNPRRFGCPIFEKEDLKELVEKPECPQTNLAISGLYFFNSAYYFDAFNKMKPSNRNEYELTDLLNYILRECPNGVIWQTYEGFWSDAGTFESISDVENYLRNQE